MTDFYTRLIQQMMESGQEMLGRFNPALQGRAANIGMDLPTMSAEMMEMWFGKTFNREGLDAKTRLLVTLAGLVAQGAGAEAQIRLTVRHALAAGASEREIMEVIWQMGMFGGLPAMQKAFELTQSEFSERKEGTE